MSIIYEALKKAESKNGPSTSGDAPLEINYQSRKNKKKPPLNKDIFLVSLAVLIILGSLSLLVMAIGSSRQKLSSGFKITGGGQALPQGKQQARAKPKPSGKYILEGIIYDETIPFAIVNGEVLKKSDKIDTFIVSAITESTIELTDPKDATTLELSLNF